MARPSSNEKIHSNCFSQESNMRAIRVHQHGGPEVMKLEDIPMPQVTEGKALVKLQAIGVNFVDVYHRTGLYPLPLPFTPGMEGSGTVEQVGHEVSEIRPGDRVSFAVGPGGYAEYALISARQLVKLPARIDFGDAAAATLQGMTAHYLTHSTFPLKQGDKVLLHAAAGGAGLLITQMAKKRGAWIAGTVSSDEKAKLAKEAGIDEVVNYSRSDFVAEVKRFTNGEGVNVVYDSVGKSTYQGSLDCLTTRGTLVLFGQASGLVPPIDPGSLASKGSLFLTRPLLGHYVATREELLQRAGDVLQWVENGQLKLRIERSFPLDQCAEAHRQLESRSTTGKILLVP
jgi:NADPH2:quinone reductase